jgi:hypothetical protein
VFQTPTTYNLYIVGNILTKVPEPNNIEKSGVGGNLAPATSGGGWAFVSQAPGVSRLGIGDPRRQRPEASTVARARTTSVAGWSHGPMRVVRESARVAREPVRAAAGWRPSTAGREKVDMTSGRQGTSSGERFGLSPCSSVGLPPADRSCLNFHRTDNRPTEVNVSSIGLLWLTEVA